MILTHLDECCRWKVRSYWKLRKKVVSEDSAVRGGGYSHTGVHSLRGDGPAGYTSKTFRDSRKMILGKENKTKSVPRISFLKSQWRRVICPKNLVTGYKSFFTSYLFIPFRDHCYGQSRGSQKNRIRPSPDLGRSFRVSETFLRSMGPIDIVLSRDLYSHDFAPLRP